MKKLKTLHSLVVEHHGIVGGRIAAVVFRCCKQVVEVVDSNEELEQVTEALLLQVLKYRTAMRNVSKSLRPSSRCHIL